MCIRDRKGLLRIPFGALVDFLPSPVQGKQTPKFAPKSIPGVFLGVKLHPGGRWRGEYIAIPLSDFANCSSESEYATKLHIHTVKEVFCAELQTAEKNSLVPFKFPLKERYDKIRRELPTNAGPRANANTVPKGTTPANANSDKGPTLSVTEVSAQVGDDPVIEESRHMWTRTDLNAQRFQSTQDSLGPAWANVIRLSLIHI